MAKDERRSREPHMRALPGRCGSVEGRDALRRYLDELGNQWEAVRDHHLEKVYKFRNFRQALEFTVAVGEIAERKRPSPGNHAGLGQSRPWSICTHKIDGLTESDFVLAAKADRAFAEAGCLPQ